MLTQGYGSGQNGEVETRRYEQLVEQGVVSGSTTRCGQIRALNATVSADVAAIRAQVTNEGG
jgi:hypothetical protein